jgi:hypothetical protein
LPQAPALLFHKKSSPEDAFDASLEVLPGCPFGCERMRFYSNITRAANRVMPARD